jgi:hypothetical protein
MAVNTHREAGFRLFACPRADDGGAKAVMPKGG